MDVRSWFKMRETSTASKMLEMSSLTSLAPSCPAIKGAKEPKPKPPRKDKKTNKKPPVTGVVKVRAYPVKGQRKLIEFFLKGNRFVYNLLVEQSKGCGIREILRSSDTLRPRKLL